MCQGIFRSDCANAEGNPNLPWAHMSEGTFSDVEANYNQSTESTDVAIVSECRLEKWS